LTVHAIVVGIDHYDLGGNFNGAAESARRFANNLPQLGVSAQQTELLITPSQSAERPATFQNVVAALEGARQNPSDLLFFYWAGHGSIKGDQRLLYLTDTGESKWAIDFNSLLVYLRHIHHHSNTRQLFFVDACATNYSLLAHEWHCQGYDFGIKASSFQGPAHMQAAFFAASPGEPALFNRVGYFTEELLKFIENAADDAWFDSASGLRRLDHALNERFLGIRAEQSMQTPIYYWHFADGSEVESVTDSFLSRQLALDLETREMDSAGLHRFLYRTRKVPFFAREQELKALTSFLDDSRPFLWSSVTGRGGVGKSRLALEFCLKAQSLLPYWRAGFLPNTWSVEDVCSWHPNMPTLIIVDYVASRAREIGHVLRTLRSRQPHFAVRVLLLERTSDGAWVNELLGSGGNRQVTESAQYYFTVSPIDATGDPYDPRVKLGSLELQSLGAEALWKSILFLVNSSAPSLRLDAPNRDALLRQLHSVDREGSPLIAAFFAESIASGQRSPRWDAKTLIQSVLEREDRLFWTPLGVTAEEKDLLAASTMCGGIDITLDLPGTIELKLAQSTFSFDRFSTISGQSSYARLGPLLPDIVGEIFVLTHLRPKSARDGKTAELLKAAWCINDVAVSGFLWRASQDFPDSQVLWALSECPELGLAQRYKWSVAALDFIPAFYVAGAKANQVRRWLNDLWLCFIDLLWFSEVGEKALTLLPRFASEMSATFARCEQRREAIEVYDIFLSRAYSTDAADEQLASVLLSKAQTLENLGMRDAGVAVLDDVLQRFADSTNPLLDVSIATAYLMKGLILEDNPEAAVSSYDQVIRRFSSSMDRLLRYLVARCFLNKAPSLAELNRFEDELATYDAAAATFAGVDDPAIQEVVAKGLVNKGLRLGQQGRVDEEIAVYNTVIANANDAVEPIIYEIVARALFEKGSTLKNVNRLDEAIAAWDALVERFKYATGATLLRQVAVALVAKAALLIQLKRYSEAIAACDDVDRFSNLEEPAVREQLAKALVNKGIALGFVGKCFEALAVSQEVITRFSSDRELAVREQVATAAINKGVLLEQLGRPFEALQAYDLLLESLEATTESRLFGVLASALTNKAIVLRDVGHTEDALIVSSRIIDRFAGSLESTIRECVARALTNTAITLQIMNRYAASISACQQVIENYQDAPELSLRKHVASAIFVKAVALSEIGRFRTAINVYSDLVSRFGSDSELQIRESVAKALVHKGIILGRLGLPLDAITQFDDFLARFSEANEVALREQIAICLVRKGISLAELGRSEEAIILYDKVLAEFSESTELRIREQCGIALVNKGVRLSDLGRTAEAVIVFDQVVERLGSAGELALRAVVAKALTNKGMTAPSVQESLAIFDDVLDRFDEVDELPIAEQFAEALNAKVSVLTRNARFDEAIIGCDEVLARFGRHSEESLSKQVWIALLSKSFLLGRLWKVEECLACFDLLFQRLSHSTDDSATEFRARALFEKGVFLDQFGRQEEAVIVYRMLRDSFGKAGGEVVLELVVQGLVNCISILGDLNRVDEAIEACDYLIEGFKDIARPVVQNQIALATGYRKSLVLRRIRSRFPLG
jgi:tetratricopeptide (TPR) repeat protein